MDESNKVSSQSLIDTGQRVLAKNYAPGSLALVSGYGARVRDADGRFAFVGLPCHVHGLRLLAEEEPEPPPELLEAAIKTIGQLAHVTEKGRCSRQLQDGQSHGAANLSSAKG